MQTPRIHAIVLGVFMFCASMALLVPSQVSGRSAPQVTLTSVLINKDTVTVNYTKNFTTCVHLKLVNNNQLVHSNNLFCSNSGPITVARTQFTAELQPGVKVKLCHGNNGSICRGEVTAQALADLVITKSGPASAVIGSTITYAITVLNRGEAAQNVVMTDTFPKGLQHISTTFLPSSTVNNSSNNVRCTGTSALTCTVSKFAAGGSLTFNIAMKVATPSNQPSPPTPYCPSFIRNSASVRTSTREINTANNTSAIVNTSISCLAAPPLCTLTSLPAAVQDFVNAEYVTLEEACAKIGKNASRKDAVRLTVELNGGILSSPPIVPSFDDVSRSHSHFEYFEESGKEGWIRGENNCYGTHPCVAFPENALVRGYFSELAKSGFGLTTTGAAPQFLDNPAGSATATALQTAADHCVLLPDATGKYISPNGVMIFEDMIAAFKRIDQGNLQWGRDCGPITSTQSLTVGINGPVSRTYAPGQSNAVLGNIVFTPSMTQADIRQVTIAIEGQNNGKSFGAGNDIDKFISNVQLRNTVTGLTAAGTAVYGGSGGASTYEMYTFENFAVKAGEVWEFRVNLKNGTTLPKDGDQFRIHICTQATGNPSGCTFSELVAPTIADALNARNLQTSQQITDIRPGGTVSGNYHKVAAPILSITQKATASNDTVVQNQKNVSLLRFEARAQNADTLLTQAVFSAAQGSLTNGQNYALWVDTNNDAVVDTILQKNVSAQSSTITFNAIVGGGYVVPNSTSVIFEVHTDIVASLASPVLQLKFATTATGYIEAELVNDGSNLSGIKTDGVCASSCQITVGTTSSTIYSLRSQGDLYVTKSSTPVRSHMLLGGSLSEEILRLSLQAQSENIDVFMMVFTAVDPDASFAPSNVDRLELFTVGATTPFAMATIGSCGSDPVPPSSFCARMNNRELLVQNGSQVQVLVRSRMRTDEQGAVSGKHVRLSLNAVIGMKARGDLSSNTLLQNDGDSAAEGEVFIGTSSPASSQTITGNDNLVVLSKITSITNADPNTNGTAIPTGVQRAIGQFKFSAAAANNTKNGQNKWTLTDVIFTLIAPNVHFLGDEEYGPSSLKLYNKADPTIKSPCYIFDHTPGSPVYAVGCWDVRAASVNTEIDSGSDATFVLEAEILNAKVSNTQSSSLQVSLDRFADPTLRGMALNLSHMRWLDKDFSASQGYWWVEYPDTVINGTRYQN